DIVSSSGLDSTRGRASKTSSRHLQSVIHSLEDSLRVKEIDVQDAILQSGENILKAVDIILEKGGWKKKLIERSEELRREMEKEEEKKRKEEERKRYSETLDIASSSSLSSSSSSSASSLSSLVDHGTMVHHSSSSPLPLQRDLNENYLIAQGTTTKPSSTAVTSTTPARSSHSILVVRKTVTSSISETRDKLQKLISDPMSIRNTVVNTLSKEISNVRHREKLLYAADCVYEVFSKLRHIPSLSTEGTRPVSGKYSPLRAEEACAALQEIDRQFRSLGLKIGDGYFKYSE
ncbi:hypothetical protein ADUPG1_010283, partial [Aduncisulcus paluster]